MKARRARVVEAPGAARTKRGERVAFRFNRIDCLRTISGAVSGAALSAVLGAIPAGGAFASGFAVEHHNARALGAAFAGAQARRADAGFAAYNPAAIAGLARAEISSSATALWGPTEYADAEGVLLGTTPIAGRASDDGVLPPAFIPSFAYAAPLADRIAVGLTVISPFGLRSEFADDAIVRYHALDSRLLTIAVSPTLAVDVAPGLTIGASLRLQYADISLETAVDAAGLAALLTGAPLTPGTDDVLADLDGDDLAVGFTAGAQIEVTPRLRVGFSYASKIEHDLRGDAAFGIEDSAAGAALNAATGVFAPTKFSGALSLPATYALGAAYEASPALTLLASATYTRWSVLDRLEFAFDNPAQPPEAVTQDWSDTWAFSFGADYALGEKTGLRAGFMFDETPVNDAFAGPRIPDTDRYWLTVGLTRRLNERLSADLAAGYVFSADREVALTGAAPEDLLRGSLSTSIAVTTYVAGGRLRYAF
ncbi:OmpP1/FadL family transporter [Amphiplicatus metriothermophilus]|nr:OmpP1/FadL family transporter [Amphiplicatus metriothermophilus]MBB5517469.1 long-chain fatty acid transport protein [Amphiplicatus metriothermophilus]